jgi:FHA domain
MRGWTLRLFTFALAIKLSFLAKAEAAPVARVLRIDPEPATAGSTPVVTFLIDLTEPKRQSDVTKACSGLTGNEALTCESDAVERPFAVHQPYPFPSDKVLLTIRIGNEDVPTHLVQSARFGDSSSEPGIATAWLVVLDTDDRGKNGFDELRQVAQGFIGALGPADLVNVVVLGERSVLSDSSWQTASERTQVSAALDKLKGPVKSRERTRPLLTLLRKAVEDAFVTFEGPKGRKAPLHQAVVFLSSGFGGGDPATTGPGALELHERLTTGNFGSSRTTPKFPLPMVSVMTPPSGYPEYASLARDFMQNLANPEIGGFFTVIQDGQGSHATRIVDAVRSRFAELTVARFRLACVAPQAYQSFSLLFPGADPAILGDASFEHVPLGIDPSAWPLDVDVALTRRKVEEAGGLFPGGTFKVFGHFCWGGDLARPEVYFLPPGEALPELTSATGTASAEEIRRRLIALDMRSAATSANDAFAEFEVPESERILHGSGDRQTSRFIVMDRLDRRTSGLTAGSVIEVRSRKRPVPLVWTILGTGGVAAVLLLIVYSLLRMIRERRTALATYSGIRVETSPYVAPAPVSRGIRRAGEGSARAILLGKGTRFTVLENIDLTVGRDGARVAAVIRNPQVSGLHATFRLQSGVLSVRDESSSTGTRVGGSPIVSGQFVDIKPGQEVALGPEVFRVELGASK